MERIIRDLLFMLGVEHPHPEDVARIKLRYFDGVKGVRVAMFRLVWPLFFARWLKARSEQAWANAEVRKWE